MAKALERILNIFRNCKFILIILFVLFSLAVIVNHFIDPKMAFLSGEYVFSFDYSGHIKNIISDFRLNNDELLKTNLCNNCPLFYHYSKWYSLVKFSILNVGNLFRLNPFIFYLFITISSQFIALYIFTQLFFKKVDKFAFLISGLIFIIYPVKYSYLANGSLDGVIHSTLLLSLSLLTYLLKNLSSSSGRKAIFGGFFLGLISSSFLNISIGYLPIFFYCSIIIIVYFWKTILENLKKAILILSLASLLPALLNFPLVISSFISKNPRTFTNYLKLGVVQSLTAGATGFPTIFKEISPRALLLFFGIIIFLFFQLKARPKKLIVFISIYLLMVVILVGGLVYNLIFFNLPLMSSLRSVHRFLFFQHWIIFIIIYWGIICLKNSKNKFGKLLAVIFSFTLVVILTTFIFTNQSYIYKTIIPNEYFEADRYLSNIEETKIYFPFYSPQSGFDEKFSWAKEKAIHSSLYGNLFTSLFAVPNLIHAEKYPFTTNDILELRSLLDYNRNSFSDILTTLKYKHVKYLIFDNNYDWKKNFPKFNTEKFLQSLTIDKKFGNLYIYRIGTLESDCKKSYGSFDAEYCRVNNGQLPDFLINVEKEDFLLDRYSLENPKTKLKVISKDVHDGIGSPVLQEYVLDKKIDQSGMMMIDNTLNKQTGYHFSGMLNRGNYRLIIPIFRVNLADEYFKKSTLEVYQDFRKLISISPYGPKTGINFEIVNLEVLDKSKIRLAVEGEGFLVVKNPFVLNEEQWNKIISTQFTPKVIYSSIYPRLKEANLIINNAGVDEFYKMIDPKDPQTGIIRVDLLAEKFVDKIELGKFKKVLENGKTLYITIQGDYVLSYDIETNFSGDLKVLVSTYWLNQSKSLIVEVIDQEGDRLIFQSEKFNVDGIPRIVKIPKEKLNGINKFTLLIKFKDDDGENYGVSLYKLGLEEIIQ